MTSAVAASRGAFAGRTAACDLLAPRVVPAPRRAAGSAYAVVPYSARRANSVTPVARATAAVFGSPSVRRANGGAQVSYVPLSLRSRAWFRRCAQVPVFEVDRKGTPASERLPRVWVTEPAFDAKVGRFAGRAFVCAYPTGSDKGGWKALELGQRYFGEALGCDDASQRALRVECFRAAEILFLHAAQRGNAQACAKLASIYLDDLCEGRYWRGMLERRAHHAGRIDVAERAFSWFSVAASLGHAEACWQLGDLHARGLGCAVDVHRAYAAYRRAFDLAAGDARGAMGRHAGSFSRCDDPAQAGNAALRLAWCHEWGAGCEPSLEVAQSWYRIAHEFLSVALEDGSWRYKRECAEAQRGAARMAQEICGLY